MRYCGGCGSRGQRSREQVVEGESTAFPVNEREVPIW